MHRYVKLLSELWHLQENYNKIILNVMTMSICGNTIAECEIMILRYYILIMT